MKTTSIALRSAFAICFAFAMSFASCDWFDKADDVTFDVALTHTFHVNQTAEDTDVIYQVQEVLDAASASSDFAKYKDKIKNISVQGVTYEIQNCTISGILFTDGTIAYSAITATEPSSDPNIGAVASVGVENVKAAENQEKNLQYSQVALNDMSNLLKNNKELNVYLKGTLSKTPAQFDVVLTVKASVTADAL
ncbi:MAG: hypothetical protein WDO14_10895 [Bacteroidota bacterium]